VGGERRNYRERMTSAAYIQCCSDLEVGIGRERERERGREREKKRKIKQRKRKKKRQWCSGLYTNSP
jgi:hypothetical protein